MSQEDKLIEIARSQIGQQESPAGSNNTIYGKAYGVNGKPWCMMFVWWCFRESGLAKLFYDGKKCASCTTLMKWAANRGQFISGAYRKGDVFLFDQDEVPSDSEHTGIYTGERVGENYVTIEGNYSDGVYYVQREPGEIIGAFRPAWDYENADEGDAAPAKLDTIKLPQLQRGSKLPSVRAMQILLEGYGYSVGTDGCDSDFGPRTGAALGAFQKDKALEPDQICGPLTWAKLLGV